MKKTYILAIILLLILGLIGGNIIGNIVFHPQKTTYNNDEIDNNIKNISSKPTWHKIGTYNGISDDIISFNAKGNKIKIVSTGMPIKNYADNSLTTILNQGSRTVEMSQMSWDGESAVATKTKTIEVSGSGNFEIAISAYELKYWNIEVYEYY
ncbi:MAG: hypothetical protein LBM96_04875 [Methanobrevibacter sp.]|jgi:hypothetical protein|nr:hypothetical protein [Candidatus Methanoflexus mossambicus]